MNRLRALLILALLLSASSVMGQVNRGLASTRLNVRSCPSAKCQATRTLVPQTELEVLETQGDWLHVRTVPGGAMGWVHSKYVSRIGTRSGSSVDPKRDEARKRSATNTLHALVLIPLLGIPLVGMTKKQLESRAGHTSDRGPFSDLVRSPRIVASWILLVAGGAFGVALGRGGFQQNNLPLLGGKDLLYVTELCGYGGWALYWGVPPFLRWCRKLAGKLLLWGFVGCSAVVLIMIFGFFASIYYSFFGGGTLEFFKYWWRSRNLSPTPAYR